MARDRRTRALEREVSWVVAHPGRARSWSESGRISAMAMVATLALGLVVHVVGYAVGNHVISLPTWIPADLASTLISNLGIVLWTSVVLVVFLEVLPARARRRATRSMELAATKLRDQGLPVPAELEDLDDPRPPTAHALSDPTLTAILERLTAIERSLAMNDDPKK